VSTIQPPTPLPNITDPVIIDGYTQPGASVNDMTNGDNAVILIQLDGSALGAQGQAALFISAGGSTVRGLSITNFTDGSLNGTGTGRVYGGGNTVSGNFIGLAPDGTTAGGNAGSGVFILNSSNNVVGGTNPADRNVIGNNLGNAGVNIDGT